MTAGDLWGAISEDRRRDGGRHPGFRERVALRGASRERWSWSVQHVGRVSSRFARRADDSGCPLVAEEGHVSLFERASFTRSTDCTHIKEEGRGPRPREDTGARGSWPVRRVSLQKSSGDAWSRKARVSGLQKGASARVDGDLA